MGPVMMRKLMLLGAGAAGYVLGAKAGRERYEQISRQLQRFSSNPTVQRRMDDARQAARDAADSAVHRVKHETSDTSGNGTGSQPGSGSGTFGRGDEGL
jgi:hypothetical protein